MPDTPRTVVVVEAVVKPREGEPLVPFTCPWAQDGLAKALDGLNATSAGVEGYGIGKRHVQFRGAAEQLSNVDYWMKLVEFYCGADALPPALTGRDTAERVILRDV